MATLPQRSRNAARVLNNRSRKPAADERGATELDNLPCAPYQGSETPGRAGGWVTGRRRCETRCRSAAGRLWSDKHVSSLVPPPTRCPSQPKPAGPATRGLRRHCRLPMGTTVELPSECWWQVDTQAPSESESPEGRWRQAAMGRTGPAKQLQQQAPARQGEGQHPVLGAVVRPHDRSRKHTRGTHLPVGW